MSHFTVATQSLDDEARRRGFNELAFDEKSGATHSLPVKREARAPQFSKKGIVNPASERAYPVTSGVQCK